MGINYQRGGRDPASAFVLLGDPKPFLQLSRQLQKPLGNVLALDRFQQLAIGIPVQPGYAFAGRRGARILVQLGLDDLLPLDGACLGARPYTTLSPHTFKRLSKPVSRTRPISLLGTFSTGKGSR